MLLSFEAWIQDQSINGRCVQIVITSNILLSFKIWTWNNKTNICVVDQWLLPAICSTIITTQYLGGWLENWIVNGCRNSYNNKVMIHITGTRTWYVDKYTCIGCRNRVILSSSLCYRA